MQCTLNKPGATCTFATAAGCDFGDPSDTCDTIAEKCEGCANTVSSEGGTYCTLYAAPAAKWAVGYCNMATHLKLEQKKAQKVNPLKASKKASGGR